MHVASGAANGWNMMSHVDVLIGLQSSRQTHPKMQQLVAAFQRHATALARVQNKSDGRWHQLVNDTSTYLETSVTSMTLYAMIEGVQHGWLSKEQFHPVIELAWNGLSKAIQPDGSVSGICGGFGVHNSPSDYQGCSTEYLFSSPGLGSVLRAAISMYKYQQQVGVQ